MDPMRKLFFCIFVLDIYNHIYSHQLIKGCSDHWSHFEYILIDLQHILQSSEYDGRIRAYFDIIFVSAF